VALIDRNRPDDQGHLIKPSDDWFRKASEKQKEIIKDIREGRVPNFDANIYADRNEIRPVLEKLFFGKCWYCEWKPTRNDWDVEHFRPKARVYEDPHHQGYYWLCYEWTNLYMSCQYCNQARREVQKANL
jgi:hypothetical protein